MNDPRKTHAGLWPDPKNGPWMIVLTWAPMDGRMECVGVEIRSYVEDGMDMDLEGAQLRGAEVTPMSAETWRQVPIASVIAADRTRTVEWLESTKAGGGPGFEVKDWAGTGRKPRHSASRVAEIYTEAWQRGEHPTKAVAEALGISSSAAAKQVSRARALGALPPTMKGRAKGQES